MTSVRVVAAVIERDGRWLLGRRPEDKRHGGLWEFPGGKMNDNESALDAAKRELLEELSLDVVGVGTCMVAVQDEGSPFVIEFVETLVDGEPEALEHSQLGWFSVPDLRGMALAPADARFVEWLAANHDR